MLCKGVFLLFGGSVNKKEADLVYEKLFLERGYSRHISVCLSGTGHIGTSWCTLNLAHTLNQKQKKVLLIDANGNLSNISSYILLNNPHYLEDYVSGKNTLNQLISAYKNPNFHILTASPGNNFLENLPIGRVHLFAEDISILSHNYNHTFIDIGADINEKNLCLCQMADDILVMCSENSSDIAKTFETIYFLYKSNIFANYNLIINRINSFEDGYKIYKEFSKAFERNQLPTPNLLGMIRFDTRIRDTIRNRDLLLDRYPASEAAVDIKQIADKFDFGE